MAKKNLRILGLDLPAWASKMLAGFGITTLLYGFIRYTFIGEWFDRLFRDMTGYAPLESFAYRNAEEAIVPARDYDAVQEAMQTSEE
ncbi:MAG TPA: hypothetical protein VG537_00360 [Candidatus Kapabacteria bacterium]|nr:hypothetical protein [Candidatus Kapabacteria bacterium]